ncbi:hypothetical protein ACWKWU_04235 [Chitinophaga lutea]
MRTLLCLLLIGCAVAVRAQDVSKLNLPGSPGFAILSFEPSAVMRPTTAKALAGDVLNSFDKDGKLLANLGLEFSPYWLQSHPRLTRESYLKPDFGQTVLRSLSISAATVKDSASGNNKLGTGLRFKLVNGTPHPRLEKVSAALRYRLRISTHVAMVRAGISGGTVTTLAGAISTLEQSLNSAGFGAEDVAEIKQLATQLSESYEDTKPDLLKFIEALNGELENRYKDLAKEVSQLLYQRQGLIVEVAGATGFNTTQQNRLDKFGVWGNLSYAAGTDDMLTMTTRYQHQRKESPADTVHTNFDCGVGYLKKTAAFNLSLEALARWYRAEMPAFDNNNQEIVKVTRDFTYRIAFQASYVIAKDISVNLSLGKDFDSPAISGNGFFSILGFNYSLFSKAAEQLKKPYEK